MNTANVSGGAIFYNLISPRGLLSNEFMNNSASYGANYASYPFRLSMITDENSTSPISSLVSGAQIS